MLEVQIVLGSTCSCIFSADVKHFVLFTWEEWTWVLSLMANLDHFTEKPPLPLTPSSTRSVSTTAQTRRRSCTASTWPLARRGPPWPSWSRGSQTLTPWSTPLWCPPPPLMLPPCSTWPPTLDAPWESTSGTTASTPWSSTTICPSRWWGAGALGLKRWI